MHRGWMFLLVLAVPFAARPDAPARPEPPPAAIPSPPGSSRVEVHVTFPPWQYTGTFRVESSTGELLDRGTARDEGGLFSQEIVERVLEGARGTLVLSVRRTARMPRLPALFGRWEIVRGTGAYAHATGGGTFTSYASSETGKGSPFELQTLVGRVRLR